MLKKLLTFFAAASLALVASAQWGSNPTVSQDDIEFWTGTGSNRAVIAVTWNDEVAGAIGIAWGVQWNGTVTIGDIMDTIALYDSRFSLDGTSSWVNNMGYTDPELGFDFMGNEGWWWYNWRDADDASKQSGGIAFDILDDGDFVDWMQTSTADEMFMATEPTPSNYPFAASSVQCWLGSGSNSAVIAVKLQATTIVYGVHWDGLAKVSHLLDTIATYDNRIEIDGIASCYIDYIEYNDDEQNLTPGGVGFMYTVNGGYAGAVCGQSVNDGDYVRFFDLSSVASASYYFVPSLTADEPEPTNGLTVDDMLYWVGEGDARAVVAISWDNDDAGLAWGVRYDSEMGLSVQDALDSIAYHDSRFSYQFSIYGYDIIMGFSSLHYSDDSITLNKANVETPCVWMDGNMLANPSEDDWTYEWVEEDGIIFISTGCYQDYSSIVPVLPPAETPDEPQPVEATIAAEDILYWVGEGENEVVLAVNWADTALAWGYRYDGTATVYNMMVNIAAADPRFDFVGNAGGLSDITYIDTAAGMTDTLRLTAGNYWESTQNGITDAGMSQQLQNGDFEKWADPAAGVVVDSFYYDGWGWIYINTYTMTINPVSIPTAAADTTTPEPVEIPVEATIAASDILYWVGEGENEVVMAINWADTALAWGYRFSDSTVSVGTVMADIAAADPRFSYAFSGMLNDINYIDTAAGMTDTLHITPGNYWESSNNGISDMGFGQQLQNGDFEKWADPAAGTIVDSFYYDGYGWFYSNVYTMEIHPVSIPTVNDTTAIDTTGYQPLQGPFCGPVGSDGCNAIAADSTAIVAWATGVVIDRGPQNIADPSSPLATYGTGADAIGQPSMTDNLSVVSLGDGGTATITFEHPIRNGEGPDFAVFENGFENYTFGLYSLELAFVEVSTDGERYVRFPATSLTQTEQQTSNSGGTDPTLINNLAGKYINGYGTPFDLAELADSTGINIDSIVYVRIVDVVGSIDPQYGTRDSHGNLINDPYPTPFASSGFDLAGVAVLHQLEAEEPVTGITDIAQAIASVYPNPATNHIVISTTTSAEGTLYDQSGRVMMTLTLLQGANSIDISNLVAGVYMLRCGSQTLKVIKR